MFKAAVEHILYPIFKNVVFISDYNSRFYRGVPDYSTRIFNPVNKLFFEIETGKHIPDSILFIAALSRNKNLGLLLVAVGKLKDQGILFHVNVVGDFKDASYRNEIFGIIENFGLKNQITFYGWRTQKEISDMHSKSAILVLTSKQESMPMVIAEAISSGRVVVATDVGGIAEMFEDGKSGFLFPSNDSDALVLILKRLHSDSHFLAEISENAKSLALRQFHPDIIAGELLEFYYQVLNKKNY
jgi:glycosyltransferase involved in cell wall biosynthesis